MNDLKVALAAFVLVALTACSGGEKKILVMASGEITADEKDPKNIKLVPGTRHNEKEIVVPGGDKQTITVQSPAGNKTYDVNENGHYVLNLKPDTLVGGIVRYGTGYKTSNLSGEDVDHIIDSTQKLLIGQNASDANKTYFITPFSIKKISPNSESRIIGPYNGIPGSVDMDNAGKGPEMYKLFTAKQKRQSLDDLIKERKK